MGRRSAFPRRKHDAYATPARAILRLAPQLRSEGIKTFAEPCCGDGALVRLLEGEGFECVYSGDILTGQDALRETNFGNADAIVTNGPWTRRLIHPLIAHFVAHAPVVWVLLDANWSWIQMSAPYIGSCTHVLPTHRVKWIEGSKYNAKDDCCWYRFARGHVGLPQIIPWREEETI